MTPSLNAARKHVTQNVRLKTFSPRPTHAWEEAAHRYATVESQFANLLDPMPLEALSHVFRLTIVVHPGFRHQGVGEALMRDLMVWAKQTPRVGKIELLVRATNERAIRLYLKLGFVEEGRFRNRVRLPDGSFLDDLAMAWFPRRE